MLRAEAAHARGEVTLAIERYWWALKLDPSRAAARTRLAELLAQTRRVRRARGVIEEGLALDGVDDATRGEWKALLLRWDEGEVMDASDVAFEGTNLRALGDVPTARLDAHRTDSHPRGDVCMKDDGDHLDVAGRS